MVIEEAIVDLLLRHNCVVVPAFGGFIAQSSSAVIDMNTGVMLPPRKSVLFNRQLINNDGLLIAHLSTEGGLNYSAAENLLRNQVADWQARMQEGQRVSIDKIGHLYLDAERNITFEQDRFFNLLLQSYGLNKVHFITEEEVKIAEYQHRPEKVAITIPIIEEEKIDFHPREIPVSPIVPEPAAKVIELHEDAPSRKKLWKYAVAAALIPFAFYTYWIPMQTNVLESGMISFKDFNPAYHAGEGVYQKKGASIPKKEVSKEKTLEQAIQNVGNNVDVYSYKYDDDLFIPVRLNRENLAIPEPKLIIEKIPKKEIPVVEDLLREEVKPETQKTKTVVSQKTSGPQYIVGAFSNEENAKTMVETLKAKSLNARLVVMNDGMFRVSAGGSDNMIEMDAIIEKSEAAGFKGWVLK